jgi:hypothetical protein
MFDSAFFLLITKRVKVKNTKPINFVVWVLHWSINVHLYVEKMVTLRNV